LWGEAGAKFAHSRKGRKVKGGRVEGGGREMRREERYIHIHRHRHRHRQRKREREREREREKSYIRTQVYTHIEGGREGEQDKKTQAFPVSNQRAIRQVGCA
jgi:hypothetical protein